MSKAKQQDQSETEFVQLLEKQVADFYATHAGVRNKAHAKALIRNEALLTGLGNLFKEYPWPSSSPYKGPKHKNPSRILNLMLSDLHYGSDIGLEETGTPYGVVEEARRTAHVVQSAAEWKRQYRKDTVLYVHLLGDIIEGKLHDPETAAPLAEQVHRAWWILGQAFRFLAGQFSHVTIFCTPGNHGRRKDRHGTRAVNQKWDSIENMIYGGLKLALSNVPNITVNVPMTPYYTYKAFDRMGFMTHGDTVLNTGFPSKSINVESLRRQINEINVKEKFDLFGAGHVHVASNVRLPSGSVVVTNGCLVPSGEYGQAIGMMQTACCQQIWESVPGIIYGHRMEILVDERIDAKAELDKIIKPYPGTSKLWNG